MRNSLSATFFAALIGLGLAGAAPARAAIIQGELNIVGAVRVTAGMLDFFPLATGTGIVRFDDFTQEGSFTAVAGTTGRSRDLDAVTDPVGVPISVANFLTFDEFPSWSFTLEFIEPGIFTAAGCAGPPAPGQNCTPFPNSQFNLSNITSRSSTASFTVRGTASDGSSSPKSEFIGTYTTQFTNQNLQQVLATISQGRAVQATYSANFLVTPVAVPEPSTISLFLAGALLIGGVLIIRRPKA
jgi:hypothetical protein